MMVREAESFFGGLRTDTCCALSCAPTLDMARILEACRPCRACRMEYTNIAYTSLHVLEQLKIVLLFIICVIYKEYKLSMVNV